MLLKPKIILLMASLILVGCGGGPGGGGAGGGDTSGDNASGDGNTYDENGTRTDIKEDEFNDIINNFRDLGSKRMFTINCQIRNSSSGDESWCVFTGEFGSYSVRDRLDREPSEYYAARKQDDGLYVREYAKNNEEWVYSESIDNDFFSNMLERVGIYVKDYSQLRFYDHKYIAENFTYTLKTGATYNISKFTYVFHNGYFDYCTALFTDSNNQEYELISVFSEIGEVTLPDRYETYVPGQNPELNAKLDESQFGVYRRNMHPLYFVTGGTGNVKIEIKQNGRVTDSSDVTYGYEFNEGSWSINTISSTGTEYATYKSMNEKDMTKLPYFYEGLINNFDNVWTDYFVTDTAFRVLATGKFDYAKAYPGHNIKGILDVTLTLEWDFYGMLTRWLFNASGNLTQGDTTVAYEDIEDVSATWTYRE